MEQQSQLPANGRTEEEILKHLDDQEKSGFTVKYYCEMFDIIEQTFYSWLKKQCALKQSMNIKDCMLYR